jgi:hypothetical protein
MIFSLPTWYGETYVLEALVELTTTLAIATRRL